MKPRPETPYFPITDIVVGHFQKERGYTNWRLHGTPDWLLIYTVAGRGTFGYSSPAGHQHVLSHPGDAVLLRPGTLHDYEVPTQGSPQSWDLLWAHFHPRPHWLDLLRWPPVAPEAPGLMRLSLSDRRQRADLTRRLSLMHTRAISSSPRRHDLALNTLEDILLTLDSFNPLQAQSRIDPRIRASMDFLCQNLGQKITLDQLARQANLSVSRLAHLFHDQTGVTPQRFLELQRLNRAKQLLAFTPVSIKEIAYQVGFQNPFYFTLRFKRYTSQSPRAYRRSH